MTRARDLGVPFEGDCGALNAITDVAGVEVGYTTLVSGEGDAAVRTGVTVILPRGRTQAEPVFAGTFALNGNGEMTGTAWIEEAGCLEGPVAITNTHSVGVVRDAIVRWQVRNAAMAQKFALPVVAETCDALLNDMNGFHVHGEHLLAAIESARPGAIAEGNVGGGAGMVCFRFKGGTGSASRVLAQDDGGYTVGVLVQANFGLREQLTIAGVPVGREIGDRVPQAAPSDRAESGSIIVVIATDAPLLPHQLKRLARRASIGLARTGGMAGNGSGDLFIAFSTANAGAVVPESRTASLTAVVAERITPLFDATTWATEEAIVNALVAAQTMTGFRGNVAHALPHADLCAALRKYGRLA
jgi:D-aminopeptidase